MKSLILAGAAALAFSAPALADVVVKDAYARSAMATAKTGAAFMVIENTGAGDDRLVNIHHNEGWAWKGLRPANMRASLTPFHGGPVDRHAGEAPVHP